MVVCYCHGDARFNMPLGIALTLIVLGIILTLVDDR